MVKRSNNLSAAEILYANQRDNMPHEWRLSYGQLLRLSKYFKLKNGKLEMFDKNSKSHNECIEWDGYYSSNKSYIPFFFSKDGVSRKVSLQRLLYLNFKGDIEPHDYLVCKCPLGRKCCNINHIITKRYHVECTGSSKCYICKERIKRDMEIQKIKEEGPQHKHKRYREYLKFKRTRLGNVAINMKIAHNVTLDFDSL